LLRTTALPKICKVPTPTQAERASGTNGQGYVGVSSPTYGTLTAFRQNSLTLDAVFDYDPFGASYALFTNRLPRKNLRRWQYPKLQKHDVA
jgi:predicted porin